MAMLSNPLGGMTAAVQQKAIEQYQAERERRLRSLLALVTMLVGIGLLSGAGAVAFGWAGALLGLGLPLFVLGALLGRPTPE
jgi:uncharacterized membrane protein YkgB